MFYVIRVRLKPNKEVEQCDTDPIVPPDLEMWAVYESGNAINQYESLHTTIEQANIACEIRTKFNETLKNKNRGPK